MPITSALQWAELSRFSQVRAFAADVLYTEGMPAQTLYVVKEGEVDLYLVREEKRTVVETIKRGQCFGWEPHLQQRLRVHNAAARSYCELVQIPGDRVEEALAGTPDLAHALVHTLSERLAEAHRLIGTRVNFQPELLIYAQLLQLLGRTDVARQAPPPGRRSDGAAAPVLARPLLKDFVAHARLMFGHSDRHIAAGLAKLQSLHLVRIEDERGTGKQILFDPEAIMGQVRKVVDATPMDADRLTYEYVSVDEFAALVEVDRSVLLRKLSGGEFADDIFTFRRAEILRLLDEKGRRFFAERKIKTPADFTEVADLEFADAKSLFAVVSKFDTLELAKVLFTVEDGPVRTRILGSLSQRRREEVESDLSGLAAPDPVEVQRLGKRLVDEVKALMIKAG